MKVTEVKSRMLKHKPLSFSATNLDEELHLYPNLKCCKYIK